MKYLYTVLLCCFCLLCKSQELSFDQLISYLHQPAQVVGDSLNSKGWKLNAALSATREEQMYQTFSFGNLKGDSTQALAWLRIHADQQLVNQLYYQLPGQEAYAQLLNKIKSSGTERKEMQTIENNQVSTFYQSQDYTFQTIAGGGTYTVMVMIKSKD